MLDGLGRGRGRTTRAAYWLELHRRPCRRPALCGDDGTTGDRGEYRTVGVGGAGRNRRCLTLTAGGGLVERIDHGATGRLGARRRQVRGEKETSQNQGYAHEPDSRTSTGGRSRACSICPHTVPSRPKFPFSLGITVTYHRGRYFSLTWINCGLARTGVPSPPRAW